MSATFFFAEDNGASTGNPAQGTTRTNSRTDMSWKNIDDSTTPYGSSPITAGTNSYEKFQFGVFTGTYNQISAGLWQHASGDMGAGLVIKAVVSGTGQGSYTTPATTTNANLTRDLTQTGLIATGLTVLFGAVGPQASGKTAASSAQPVVYSQYLISQLQTSTAANAGDTVLYAFQLQYAEN